MAMAVGLMETATVWAPGLTVTVRVADPMAPALSVAVKVTV